MVTKGELSDDDKERIARLPPPLNDPEVYAVFATRIEEEMAWRRVRGKVYRRSTMAAALIGGFLAFRNDMSSLFAWMSHIFSGR